MNQLALDKLRAAHQVYRDHRAESRVAQKTDPAVCRTVGAIICVPRAEAYQYQRHHPADVLAGSLDSKGRFVMPEVTSGRSDFAGEGILGGFDRGGDGLAERRRLYAICTQILQMDEHSTDTFLAAVEGPHIVRGTVQPMAVDVAALRERLLAYVEPGKLPMQ